jgi:hypothetical protein
MSYHRNDISVEDMYRIFKALCTVFGKENVFFDREVTIKNIEMLKTEVMKSHVVIVLMGQQWYTEFYRKKETRSAEIDWTEEEIYTALHADDVFVLPVLVNGAPFAKPTMPDRIKGLGDKIATELKTIQPVAFRQGMNSIISKILENLNSRSSGVLKVYADGFPTDFFRDRIRKTKSGSLIRVNTIWWAGWDDVTDQLRDAIVRGAKLQVLLMKPECVCCGQRDRDLALPSGRTSRAILENTDDLRQIAQYVQSQGGDIDNVELRYFDAIPGRVIFSVDRYGLIGSHSPLKRSSETPFIEIFGYETDMYRSIKDQFEALWTYSGEQSRVVLL